ncbi:hypothetical protein Vretimale_405 [Volvox reticuliferus]|uniref:Uncharacterized protein n=1 Tax=Volvox reticuliferus TaxID=1737510 RepID=A0A8J4D1S4_9CHLO|nr:hypothetical protein Vretimale_405 [Volvox reticuliferus]
MTMANTTCESFYHSPSSGPRSRRHGCTECIEPGMAEYQAGSNSEYFSPGPSLASATDYDNTSDLCNGKDAVFDNRRAMCFPGAWAIGEGVLLEVLEEDGVGSPTASEDSADSSADSIRRRTLSCLAGNLTATMGTYLTNLASAITGAAAMIPMAVQVETLAIEATAATAAAAAAAAAAPGAGRRRPAVMPAAM